MVLTILLEVFKHEITMVKQKEIALNTFDDKRFYIDKYNSIPWGHNPT